MMLYVRAEGEGDWPLHLQALVEWALVELVMPYFISSCHNNYAKYCFYYLRSMEALPANVFQHFNLYGK